MPVALFFLQGEAPFSKASKEGRATTDENKGRTSPSQKKNGPLSPAKRVEKRPPRHAAGFRKISNLLFSPFYAGGKSVNSNGRGGEGEGTNRGNRACLFSLSLRPLSGRLSDEPPFSPPRSFTIALMPSLFLQIASGEIEGRRSDPTPTPKNCLSSFFP